MIGPRVATVSLALMLAGGGGLVACGDDGPSADEQALLDDQRYGPETFESADYSAQMSIDDDQLSVVPSGDGGDGARLSFDYFGDGDDVIESLSNVEVNVGSVIAFRDYRIRVTDVGERGVDIQWAKLAE